MCFDKQSFVLKYLPSGQMLHLKGLSSLWVAWCLTRLPFTEIFYHIFDKQKVFLLYEFCNEFQDLICKKTVSSKHHIWLLLIRHELLCVYWDCICLNNFWDKFDNWTSFLIKKLITFIERIIIIIIIWYFIIQNLIIIINLQLNTA